MITVHITIDEKNYGGEDYENTIAASVGSSKGWYDRNLGEMGCLLLDCKEPKNIHGIRNLKSEIDKIMRRIEIGALTVNQIVITINTPNA